MRIVKSNPFSALASEIYAVEGPGVFVDLDDARFGGQHQQVGVLAEGDHRQQLAGRVLGLGLGLGLGGRGAEQAGEVESPKLVRHDHLVFFMFVCWPRFHIIVCIFIVHLDNREDTDILLVSGSSKSTTLHACPPMFSARLFPPACPHRPDFFNRANGDLLCRYSLHLGDLGVVLESVVDVGHDQVAVACAYEQNFGAHEVQAEGG